MEPSGDAQVDRVEVSEEGLHRALGLTDAERDEVEGILGRAPNHLELALFAVMWSEHCSYKSSRVHLRRLPTEGPHVLVGPGENAGVIDAGDGIAVAIRIESHNHPSAIEPYQGAATGVGGILRDIFTMGARPIAVMDPLFFGDPTEARQQWLIEGVVAGISGYGNSVGVPTIGGELTFDPCYSQNPLVNVLCLGVLPTERLVLGQASGPGNLAVLLGSSTGRDGIGGVSVLASAGFGGGDEAEEAAKRPSVQVGDPYEEKRLIEACLELLDAKLVVGIQDLGGAGLVCATSETAARGGVGMDVDVSAVPRREPGMVDYEVMTSESQERMLAIVTPGDLARVQEVCAKWEVRAAVVGRVTEAPDGAPGRLRILDGFDGAVLGDVPAVALSEDAPLYRRPLARPADQDARLADDPGALPGPSDCGHDLLALLADPTWVYRQYDHQLFLNTVEGPGGDSAVLRLAAPGLPASERGLALTTDSNPTWCALDPRAGTVATVAEAALNLACSGATPKAVVNCLNFGNPEHPEVMWQLSEAVDGMSEACRALGLPVIGGNVSLYNESFGRDIDPTPVIGALGLIEHLAARPPGVTLVEGGTPGPAGRQRGHVGRPAPAAFAGGFALGRPAPPPPQRHACPPSTSPGTPDWSTSWPAWWPRGWPAEGRWSRASTTYRAAASGSPWPNWRSARASGCRSREWPTTTSSSPRRRRGWWSAPRTRTHCSSRAADAGVGFRVLGSATGGRIVIDDLVDLDLGEAAAAWRGRLPDLLDDLAPVTN